jgi:hypothetical protein
MGRRACAARAEASQHHRLAAPPIAKVSSLIRAHCRDFGPTLAAEYLAERHGITLSKETLRQFAVDSNGQPNSRYLRAGAGSSLSAPYQFR